MYRRATSGAFIVVTTFLIVVVMALFTWVIYGMARQVYTLTDTMIEMNQNFGQMVTDMDRISENMGAMTGNMDEMTRAIRARQRCSAS